MVKVQPGYSTKKNIDSEEVVGSSGRPPLKFNNPNSDIFKFDLVDELLLP